jgi:hypothetical protein
VKGVTGHNGRPQFITKKKRGKKMVYRDIVRWGAKALLSSSLVGLILLSGCKTQKLQTYWSAKPVKVDGEMTEWPSGSIAYFEDLGVQLGLRNDDQNLYVLFRFNNQAWARAIRMGGMTLWLDNSGKKKKDFGIRYRGGPSFSDLKMPGTSDRGGFQQAMTPEQQKRLLDMEQDTVGQITVIDKKGNQEMTIRPDGSGGPAVSFASPQGTYTYEFSIPLKRSDVFRYAIGAQPGQVICLGLEWGGINKEDRQEMRDRMGGGMGGPPPGGMSGGPPGGMGGPPDGRGGGRGMQTPEEEELWVKTQLALPSSE